MAEGETETEEEVDLWSYLFPLSLYHTRWSELSYDDYDFYLGNVTAEQEVFQFCLHVLKILQVLT
ncbi:MAG: hypothetical protein ACLT2Z_09830 [Eubacterium sp.]